jgi:hypothetical protein
MSGYGLLNNKVDSIRETKKHQKKWLIKRKARTKALKYLRRELRDKCAKERKKVKIVAFGYWREWFKMGLIGVEEEQPSKGIKVLKT